MKAIEESRKESIAALVYGSLAALAIDIGWLFFLYPYMGPNRWRWPIAIASCLVQTIFTIAGIWLVARLHRRLKVNIWFSIPYGVLAGALAGAISIGLAIGLRGWLGMKSGMIQMEREDAWLNAAPAWRQFWEGAKAGLAFGAVGGYIPGALGSLALSIWRAVSRKKSAAKNAAPPASSPTAAP